MDLRSRLHSDILNITLVRFTNWRMELIILHKLHFRYIRLSDATPMEKVKTLLVDHWGIFRPNRPHLALALVGGAKNFRLEGRKKETFKVDRYYSISL